MIYCPNGHVTPTETPVSESPEVGVCVWCGELAHAFSSYTYCPMSPRVAKAHRMQEESRYILSIYEVSYRSLPFS